MSLGIIAGIISALAFVPYCISILKGKTKPNRASWWIWFWLGILAYFSYKASGAHDTLWVALVYVITPFITAMLSLKYGEGGWNKFDLACLGCSIVGSLVWFISSSPLIALLLFLSIDLFGALPTLKKTYYHPETENSLAWFLMAVGNLVNVFAAEQLKFSILVYPLYMLIVGGLILGLSLRKARIT